MILGCGVYQIPLIEHACGNYEVVLIAPAIPENIRNNVYKCYYLDLRNQEEILEIAQQEKIDGIITDQTDIPVRSVAYVAEKMNLPGNLYETACLFTDKGLMREKLKNLNLRYIPYCIVSNCDDAVCAANKICYPVIIKPVDNQGSRGVFYINDERVWDYIKVYRISNGDE